MATAACYCVILVLVPLVLSSLNPNASAAALRTFVGVDTSSSPAETFVIRSWTVRSIAVERFATTASVRRAGNVRFIDAVVGRWRRRRIAARGCLGARARVRVSLTVGNMCAREGVMVESVGCVLIRGRGAVPVGRSFTRGCLVMSRRLCVVGLVIKFLGVGIIGVRRGVTVVRALRLVGLWLLSLVDVEERRNRFLAVKMWCVRGNARG